MTSQTKNILRPVILFALLLIPVFYTMGMAIELEYSWMKKIVYLTVVIVLLVLPALFLKARTYFIAEGVLNFLFFPIEIASLYLNHQSTSAPFLQNIFHTNLGEATELMMALWPLCLIVTGLWILYFLLAFRVTNTYLFDASFRKWIIGIAVALMAGGLVVMTVFIRRIHPERTAGEALREAVGLVELKLNKIYPYNLYIHSTSLWQRQRRVKRMEKEVSAYSFGIRPVVKSSNELYILVIGEASRYDHWSLNGYTRNTTPLLKTTDHLVSYAHVYTEANQTDIALPILLTRANAACMDISYREKSLPEAYQEAGVWTGYISKQVSSDFTERIRQNCDYSYFYAKNFDADGNYDKAMIDQVRTTISDTTQFYLLHSLGSHFRYEHRYPETFSIYEPVLGKSAGYTGLTEANKIPMINAYDNSIRYTDYFLHSLIQYIDSLDRVAVLVYLSDHGESFWDDSRKLSLHGSYQTSEAEYHVPMIVWYSDEYAACYPEKVKTIEQNKTTPVSSDVVFYSMLDIAGIENGIDSTRSICSPALLACDTVWVHTGAGTVEPFVIP